MTYDYFYGQQAEMFTFYRVPKVLFTEDCFWNVSTDAKLLYGILLDRMNLSARNGWLDEEGRVYIIFTIEEIKGALGCALKAYAGVHAAFLSAMLAMNNTAIPHNFGVIGSTAEQTAKNLGRISMEGMAPMDSTIISVMQEKR